MLPLRRCSPWRWQIATSQRSLQSRLILKNETDAIRVLQKLADDLPFACFVRELHIMSDLSADARPPFEAIRRVKNVTSKGYLPFIHTLGLHFMKYVVDIFVKGSGLLQKRFFVQLKKCPQPHGLILKGFEDYSHLSWLEESGIFQMPVSGATLNVTPQCASAGSPTGLFSSNKLLKYVSSLALSLNELSGLSKFF